MSQGLLATIVGTPNSSCYPNSCIAVDLRMNILLQTSSIIITLALNVQFVIFDIHNKVKYLFIEKLDPRFTLSHELSSNRCVKI